MSAVAKGSDGAAINVFVVEVRTRRRRRAERGLKTLGYLLLNLAEAAASGGDGGGPDAGAGTSKMITTILVRDRWTGRVVHTQDWSGYTPAAVEDAKRALEADLRRLNVDRFCQEYGINRGSTDPGR